MDQEVLAKTGEWQCVPQDLRMPGSDRFLGAIISKLNASSPSNSGIPQEMLPLHWGPGDLAASEKPIKQRCAEREERLGWSWSESLSILPHRQRCFPCMGRTSVTLVGCFLRSWLGLCAPSPLGMLAFALSQWLPPSSLFQFGLNAVTFLSVVYLPTPTAPPFLGNRKLSLPNPCLPIGLFHWDYNALSWNVLWKCKMVMSITILLLTGPHSLSSSLIFQTNSLLGTLSYCFSFCGLWGVNIV